LVSSAQPPDGAGCDSRETHHLRPNVQSHTHFFVCACETHVLYSINLQREDKRVSKQRTSRVPGRAGDVVSHDLHLKDSSLNTISRVVFTPGELGGLNIPCPRHALLHHQTTLTLAGARSTHPWVQAATHLDAADSKVWSPAP